MKISNYLICVPLILILVGKSYAQQANDSPPNILFIVADDLGFSDLGSFGSEISTPTLDELAYNGLRLNNLHAAAACQSTRAMLMTSAGTSATIEVRPSKDAQRDNLLSRDWAIIPELLQEAGYATYMAGKWDLGRDSGYTPATRGFDRSFIQLHGSSSYFAEKFISTKDLGFEEDGETLSIEDLPEDFYVTEHYTDKMLEYLQSNEDGKPWFAYMPYTSPHWPLQLPEAWLDRYEGKYSMGYDALREQRFLGASKAGVLPENSSLDSYKPQTEPWNDLNEDEQRLYIRAQGIYAGMVEYLDMSIGRVISYLRDSGQLENTVVIFTADHGASSGEHGVSTGRVPQSGGPEIPDFIDNSYDNFGRPGSFIDHGRGFGEAASAPFKFLKGTINEGGLRAAAFVYYPKAVEGGNVSNAQMTMMDFLPTFMQIAGTEHPGASTFRGREINDILGRSAWPHFIGQSTEIRTDSDIVGWTRGGGGALIRGDYKIINTVPPGQRGTTNWRLYNLVNDPGEHNDIADEHSELVEELVVEWEANWR